MLRPAIAEFHLRAVPAESRFPVGLRLALVVTVLGVFNVSQFATAPQGAAGARLSLIYLPPVALTAVVAYLIGRHFSTGSPRRGRRPDRRPVHPDGHAAPGVAAAPRLAAGG